MAETIRILLAGEGGQGIQSVAEIIAEAAYGEGRQALYIPSFGVEQRGGVSVAFVQISDEPVGAPKFQIADIIVALSERAVQPAGSYAGPATIFIYDSAIATAEGNLPENVGKILAIPAVETAKNELNPRVFNIIIMGAVIGATGVISIAGAKAAIESKLGYKFEKNPHLRDLNYRALERGVELVQFSRMEPQFLSPDLLDTFRAYD